MHRYLAVMTLVGATSLFGMSNVLQKFILTNLDVFSSFGMRYFIAAIALVPFSLMKLRQFDRPLIKLSSSDVIPVVLFGLASIF